MKIFLDACAIIYWVEGIESHYKKLVDTLHILRKKYKKPTFAASHLSLLECRVRPLRDKNKELLKHYQQFFCAKDLILVPLSLSVLDKAAELRAFYQIRTPAALQAASALWVGQQDDVTFITGDAGFKKIVDLTTLLLK